MNDTPYPPQEPLEHPQPSAGGAAADRQVGGEQMPPPVIPDPPTYPGAPSIPFGARYGPATTPNLYASPPSGAYPPYPGGFPPTTPPGYAPSSVPFGAPGYPPPFAPIAPQRKGLGAGAIVGIVVGSVALACILLSALGFAVNAMTASRRFASYSTVTPWPTSTSSSYYQPTDTSNGGPGAFPTPTTARVSVPPVPANCCFNMVLGHDWGTSGTTLYISGRTNNFYAGDTFAYLVNLNGHTLAGANKPAGSTNFWFYLLRPNGSGGEYTVNKFTQNLTGPNATTFSEAANKFGMINLMQQSPPGQYKAEFVTSDGSTYLGAAIFDYFG